MTTQTTTVEVREQAGGVCDEFMHRLLCLDLVWDFFGEVFFCKDDCGRFCFYCFWIFVEVFLDTEVAAHVAEGFFGCGQFFEVIEPGVFAGAAAGIGFADDGADGSVGHSAGEGLGGDLKGHDLAGFPEGRGELMGEEQSVVALFGGEHLDGVAGALPRQAELAYVPFSKFEAVGTSLSNE